jgi:Txe/YoeB family toxin of Txe-Axe toxin-antitoxin module
MYDERRSLRFDEKLNAQTKDRRQLIEDKMKMVRELPYSACKSEPLKWRYRGKRSARIDKAPDRIIYTVCQECHQQGHQKSNLMDCPGCEDVPMETVNFLDIDNYHRS